VKNEQFHTPVEATLEARLVEHGEYSSDHCRFVVPSIQNAWPAQWAPFCKM
jgi:hypothetical protein